MLLHFIITMLTFCQENSILWHVEDSFIIHPLWQVFVVLSQGHEQCSDTKCLNFHYRIYLDLQIQLSDLDHFHVINLHDYWIRFYMLTFHFTACMCVCMHTSLSLILWFRFYTTEISGGNATQCKFSCA